MKKTLCLLLALFFCLSAAAAPVQAAAEDVPTVAGYDFRLRVKTDTDHLNADSRERVKGYAELLEALEYEGTFYYYAPERALDLRLTLRPLAENAEPVSLRICGYPDALLISSDLLGEEQLLLATASLAEFSVKAHEHLGLDLQRVTLLWPFVYEYAFWRPSRRWNHLIQLTGETQEIPVRPLTSFVRSLREQLVSNSDLNTLINALSLSESSGEAVRSLFEDLPRYLEEDVIAGNPLLIRVSEGRYSWSAGGRTLFSRKTSPERILVRTDLPAMAGGYKPSLAFSSLRKDGRLQLRLDAGLTNSTQPDLLSVVFSASDLPLAWPSEASARASLTASGFLFPDFSAFAELRSDNAGQITLTVKKPSGGNAEGQPLFTLEGRVTQHEYEVLVPSREELYTHTDILRSNDATLGEFVSRVMKPALKGILGFAAGLPASSCVRLMDDLESSGVLNLLLSSD